MGYRIEQNNTATIKWVFTDKEYFYSKVEFTLKGDKMSVIMSGRKMPKQGFIVKDFCNRTAVEVINDFPNLGRPFENGVLTVWKELNLDLGYNKRILRNI